MTNAERYKQLPNGNWYDAKAKKIIQEDEVPKSVRKAAAMPQEDAKSTDTGNESQESINPSNEDKPKRKQGRPKNEDANSEIAKTHTALAMEIITKNHEEELRKTDADWLRQRGLWYFDRCAALGITPVPQGLVIALGFNASEENILLSGNGGLPKDCTEVISAFKQALEMVAEGMLVDSKSGQVGRIFDLKNRFGWSDQGNTAADTEVKRFEIKSPDELKKALAKMPGLDLIDEPKAIDIDFEVLEGEN